MVQKEGENELVMKLKVPKLFYSMDCTWRIIGLILTLVEFCSI